MQVTPIVFGMMLRLIFRILHRTDCELTTLQDSFSQRVKDILDSKITSTSDSLEIETLLIPDRYEDVCYQDSPNQGAEDIPRENVTFTADSLMTKSVLNSGLYEGEKYFESLVVAGNSLGPHDLLFYPQGCRDHPVQSSGPSPAFSLSDNEFDSSITW